MLKLKPHPVFGEWHFIMKCHRHTRTHKPTDLHTHTHPIIYSYISGIVLDMRSVGTLCMCDRNMSFNTKLLDEFVRRWLVIAMRNARLI